MLFCITTADAREVTSGDLDEFLGSLEAAKSRAVVVLRNVPDSVAQRYEKHRSVEAVLRSPQVSASEARNTGLVYLAAGGIDEDDFVAFPDDDCKYPTGFIDALEDVIMSKSPDLIIGSYGESEVDDSRVVPLDRRTALLSASTVTIFARWDLVRAVGGFNEQLGVGSPGAQYGEDNDYAIRLYSASKSSWFVPALRVWHLEQRETVGRNRKGYLTVCLLNLNSLLSVRVLISGVLKSPLQDLLAGKGSLDHCRSAAAALNIGLVRKAIRGRKEVLGLLGGSELRPGEGA